MPRVPSIFLSLLFLGLASTRAAASDQWILTDAQFKFRPISVDTIDAVGIHATTRGSDERITFKWSDVLDLSRPINPMPAVGKFDVYLATGDRLSGEPVSVAGEKLHWNSPTIGDIALPLSRVVGIVRAGKSPPSLNDARKDDVLLLANGDTTHGIVTQVTGESVTIQTGGASPTLSLDTVSALLFATPPAIGAGATSYRLRLADGTSFNVESLALAGGKMTVMLDARTSRDIDFGTVAGIEQVDGPVSWLTNRRPAENIYKPFFEENFPTQFDRTVDDLKPISVKFPGFRHGIGCHSYSKLVYNLDADFAGFRTQYVVESDSPLADVTVRIRLDDKIAFEQKNVKGAKPCPVQTVPLNGAKTLTLEVDYGANYATEGRFAWLDPALIRTLPTGNPATQP